MAKERIDPEDIEPPFSDEEMEVINEVIEEAQLNPEEDMKQPTTPDPSQPGKWINPDVKPKRIYENWTSPKGDGKFTRLDFDWQPKCDEDFYIVMREVWTPPPGQLAAKYKAWAAFATMRAVLICRRNERCRRPQLIGCDAIWDTRLKNGQHYGRASFNFRCFEI